MSWVQTDNVNAQHKYSLLNEMLIRIIVMLIPKRLYVTRNALYKHVYTSTHKDLEISKRQALKSFANLLCIR